MAKKRPAAHSVFLGLIMALGACGASTYARALAKRWTDEPPMVKASSAAQDPDRPARLGENLEATVILAAEDAPTERPLKDRNDMCPDTYSSCRNGCEWDVGAWGDEPSFAFCSGALVAPDIVITNSHCACFLGNKAAGRIRVHPANWTIRGNDEVDDWRKVQKVMIDVDSASSAGCEHDVAFLKLDGGLTDVRIIEPTSEEHARRMLEGSGNAYVIGTPLGIPDILTEGTVYSAVSDEPSRGFHSIYYAYHSSGSPIYSAETGRFLGLVTGTIGSRCSCPRVRGNNIYFPRCSSISGNHVSIPGTWIQGALQRGKWVDANELESCDCRAKKKKTKKSVPDPDWCKN